MLRIAVIFLPQYFILNPSYQNKYTINWTQSVMAWIWFKSIQIHVHVFTWTFKLADNVVSWLLLGCCFFVFIINFSETTTGKTELHYSSSLLFTPDLFRNSATDVSKSESWLLDVSSDFWATWDGTSLFSVNNTVSALWEKNKLHQSCIFTNHIS